jgi:hypothetical protein
MQIEKTDTAVVFIDPQDALTLEGFSGPGADWLDRNNSINPLANTSRRNVLATALVYAISATV